jgi:hypothetical protein
MKRLLLAALLLLVAGSAHAQTTVVDPYPFWKGPQDLTQTQQQINKLGLEINGQQAGSLGALARDASNATSGANGARVNLGVFNIVDLGADPTGSADASAIIASAISTAGTGGVVTCPNGSYKIASTVNWTKGGVSFVGNANGGCVLLPTVNGDAFEIAPSPFVVGTYLTAATMSNVTITRSDNATSGACLHTNQLQAGAFYNVSLGGCFYDNLTEQSLNVTFVNPSMSGDNTTSGATIWKLDRTSGSTVHNSGIKLIGGEIRGSHNNTYTNALQIDEVDGFQISDSHIGFVTNTAAYLDPLNDDDQIDNVFMSNTILDEAAFGLACNSVPSPLTGYFGTISLSGSSSIQNMTNSGLYVTSACAAMDGINLAGTLFFNISNYGVDIAGGTHYNLAGSIFTDTNANNEGGSAVLIGGAVSGVNLDGAMYEVLSGAAHQPLYNIVTASTADDISALDQHFSGAATGDYSAGSSGAHITITTAKTDQASPTIVFPSSYQASYASALIPSGAITSSQLAGSIAASKLVGTDIATVGTITTGTWNGTSIGTSYGGTGSTSSTAAFLEESATNVATVNSTGGVTSSFVGASGTPTAYPVFQAGGASTAQVYAGGSSGTTGTLAVGKSGQGVSFPGATTGTNADFACLSSGLVLLIQSSACTISTLRLKNLLAFLSPESSLDQIMKLKPISFTMKNGKIPNVDWNYDKPQDGLFAENVAKVMPKCAIYEQDGKTPKSYRQECAIAKLAGAIQALQHEIKALRKARR